MCVYKCTNTHFDKDKHVELSYRKTELINPLMICWTKEKKEKRNESYTKIEEFLCIDMPTSF